MWSPRSNPRPFPRADSSSKWALGGQRLDNALKELDVCPFCGRVINGDPEFCPKCGGRLAIKVPLWDLTYWPNPLIVGLWILAGTCILLGFALMTGWQTGRHDVLYATGSISAGAVLIVIALRVARGY